MPTWTLKSVKKFVEKCKDDLPSKIYRPPKKFIRGETLDKYFELLIYMYNVVALEEINRVIDEIVEEVPRDLGKEPDATTWVQLANLRGDVAQAQHDNQEIFEMTQDLTK